MDYQKLKEFCETPRQEEVFNAIIKHGSQQAAAKALGQSRSTIKSVCYTVRDNAAKRLYAPEFKLEDPLPPGHTGGYTLHLDAEGNRKQVWLKGKEDLSKAKQAYLQFIEGLRDEVKPVPRTKPSKKPKSADLASAIIFGDAHLGMIASKLETLVDDHDLDTALKDIRDAMDYCLDCVPDSEQGWFINVGDFLHADNSGGTTFNGTKQDVGVSHYRVMREAGKIIRYCISRMLKKFNTVVVVNARGNHDKDSAQALNLIIETAYENEPRVEVRANESKFTFIEFGKCLVGVNHGDQINASRLSGVMTKFASEAWGRTKYRWWWIGHIHHKDKKEQDSGVTIESFHTLAPIDAWHAASGYGAGQSVTVITLHREYGHVMEMCPSLEMIRSLNKQAA